MTDEDAFHAAIVAAPLDRLPRLVYCDWLDERGDPRAEGMRVLAVYDRWPWLHKSGEFEWFRHTLDDDTLESHESADLNHRIDRSSLCEEWWSVVKIADRWRSHSNFREAINIAVLAWNELTADQKANCLTNLDVITGRVEALTV